MSARWRLMLVTACLLQILISLPLRLAHAASVTRYVATIGIDTGNCADAANPCLTIEYAYSQAASGDTISVAAGVYTTSAEVLITQDLTLTGAGPMSTIIQAAASAGTATHRLFRVQGPIVTVQAMTLRYGVEVSGGAISLSSGSLYLYNLIVRDNQVSDNSTIGLNGGAIAINAGTLTISNTALINNRVISSDVSTSRGNGGALYVGATGVVNLNNVTLSGNAANHAGGGVYSSGTLNVQYSTIANNTSDSDNDTIGDGGGLARSAGSVNLKSSIVTGNKKGPSTDNDCVGAITSLGYNLTGNSTGCNLAGTGDVSVTPSIVFTSILAPLADNGGSTYTHALYTGSPAIEAIPNGTNNCGTTFTTDQRGGVRPYNGSCDMGAYELKLTRSVSNFGTDNGDCSMADCLTLVYAYSKTLGGETISVATGTYTLAAEVLITHDLTISGAGANGTIVQGAASVGTATHRLFRVQGPIVTVRDMTLRYGVEVSGGALNMSGGMLYLYNLMIKDNQVNNALGVGLNGGAISISGGTLTISNTALINNSVTTSDLLASRGNGGALYVGASGVANLNNVTLSGNTAVHAGGGVYNSGTLNINYSTFANNTSDSDNDAIGDGGGLARAGGTVNLASSIVAGNKQGSSTDNDCAGTVTSQGYNLTGSGTGCSLVGTGDVNVLPASVFSSLLAPLADNGGSTYTHALYSGSSAIEAIPNGINNCGTTFTTDQRGYLRPGTKNQPTNRCEIGAWEAQLSDPTAVRLQALTATASGVGGMIDATLVGWGALGVLLIGALVVNNRRRC